MKDFPIPKIVVSKCLEFDNCRYNGGIVRDQFVVNLRKYVKFDPICPEVAIGLGTPRDPIRLVTIKGVKSLYQPSSDTNLTSKMEYFSESYLNSIKDVDGFILKRGSPSCGITNVKIYTSLTKPSMPQRGIGYFAEKVLKYFPLAAIEDESRLNNKTLREHFLIKLFTNARFRQVKNEKRIAGLIDFHTKNKMLFMGQSPKILNQMGNILANFDDNLDEIINNYEIAMSHLFDRIPKISLMVNVLLKMYNGLKERISNDEKKFFFRNLEEYREGIIPLSSITKIVQSWVVRFEDNYLTRQTLFEPFPKELIKISEFDKQRELKPITPLL